MTKPTPSGTKRRDRLRRALPPIQVPVADVHSPASPVEAHRPSPAVTQGPRTEEDRAFTDLVSDWGYS